MENPDLWPQFHLLGDALAQKNSVWFAVGLQPGNSSEMGRSQRDAGVPSASSTI